MRLMAALVLAPLALAGQAAAPAPRYAPEDLCSIEGQVVNLATGDPVNKASLMLSLAAGGFESTAISDASGKFAFRNLAPDKYRLFLERTGYRSASYSMGGAPIISLDRGQRRTGLVFRVTPGRKQLMPAGAATTNDLGEYRLFGVAPGKYLVSAYYSWLRASSARMEGSTTLSSAVFSQVDPGVDKDYPLTFYPGTFDPAAAAWIEVTPGAQIRDIDFRLSKAHGVSVRGRIANPASRDPQSSIDVGLTRRNSLGIDVPPRGVSADRLGNLEFENVLPGSYELMAAISEAGKAQGQARQTLEVGTSNVEGLVFSISPFVDVRGRIRAEGQGAPDASSEIQASSPESAASYARRLTAASRPLIVPGAS